MVRRPIPQEKKAKLVEQISYERKRSKGMIGCGLNSGGRRDPLVDTRLLRPRSRKNSHEIHAKRSKPPTQKPTITFANLHRSTEPQLSASRIRIPAPANMNAPRKSMRRSFCNRVSLTSCGDSTSSGGRPALTLP